MWPISRRDEIKQIFAVAKIKITTTQNIDIEYDIASVGDRILAYAIDSILMVAYFIIVSMLISSLFMPSLTVTLLIFIPAFLYHFIMEMIFDGRSVGKMVLGLKVVMLDGSQPTLSAYALRWLVRILECNFFLLYGGVAVVTIAINGQGQRIGDILAGTAVIKTRRKVTLRDTILRKTDENYVATFPQVSMLNDSDIRTIRDVLNVFRRDRNVGLLNTCGNRVATQLNIYPGELNAADFLETILRDYNHIS